MAQQHQLDVLGCLTTTTHHDQRQQTADDRIDQREHHEIIVANRASATAIGVFERHNQRKPMWALVSALGIIVEQSGGITVQHSDNDGDYYLAFPSSLTRMDLSATLHVDGSGSYYGLISTAVCGGDLSGANAISCGSGSDTSKDAYVAVSDTSGNGKPEGFYITASP